MIEEEVLTTESTEQILSADESETLTVRVFQLSPVGREMFHL